MTVRSPLRSRAYSRILFVFVITFVLNVSLRAQAPESPSAVVRKPRAQDLNPPSAPRGLVAEVANCHQVELRWIAPADGTGSGPKAYVVRRSDGGESTLSAGRTTFSDANRVSPSTGLTYTVSAVDAEGNESAASNAVTVTTPACSSNELGVGDFEGTLEVLAEDYAGGKSRTLYFLQTDKGRLPMHFMAKTPEHFLTGTPVHIKAGLVDGALAVTSGDTSIETLALDLSSTSSTSAISGASTTISSVNTFGEQKTLVMLVNFQNDPANRPWTFDQVRNVFSTVSSFFMENSYQQTWLTTAVVGWYILPLDNTNCNTTWIGNYAQSAAIAAGINLSAYTHYVTIFPAIAACPFSGAADIGGNPSQAFINGDLSVGTIAHEMGHNLGLQHSHSLVCNNTGDEYGTTSGPYCFVLDYGDGLDTMGWSSHGFHFNAFQKEVLGWLNNGISPPIATVQTSGTYTLDPYELTGSKLKALKILKSVDATTGYKTWYYIEYRQATGFDSYLATIDPIVLNASNVLNGVLIRTGSDSGRNTSDLLDMTPETYQLYAEDPALEVGKSFSDPLAGVTIIPQWVNGASAGITVSFGTTSCVHTNPSVALSPSVQSAMAGMSLTYNVSVTNNDNSGCSTSSFSLQAALPAGWTAAFGASPLAISPGNSASTTLTVTAPATATANSYSVLVTASSSYSATAAATYSVATGLSTSVTTDATSYSRGSTVTITDSTSSGGTPVANATVTFTITKPNGATLTQTATTSASGQAVYRLRLSKQKDPSGTYQVRAVATSNGASANASTNFTVR